MENMLHPPVPQSNTSKQLLLLVVVAMLSLFCYVTYDYIQQMQQNRVNMEKSCQKNKGI